MFLPDDPSINSRKADNTRKKSFVGGNHEAASDMLLTIHAHCIVKIMSTLTVKI